MTKSQEVYATTLNILGSDVFDDVVVQGIVDHEHELADPEFTNVLKSRREAPAVAIG
jgi:hypothetical protein